MNFELILCCLSTDKIVFPSLSLLLPTISWKNNFTGISRGAFWQKIPLDDKLLDSLIFTDDSFCTPNCSSSSWNQNQSDDLHQHSDGIASRDDLKYRLLSISNTSLPAKNPLWQIRWMFLSYSNQVCLVFRVHQAVCDGVGLMSLLVSQLADQAPPSTTTFIRTCHGTMTATNCEYFTDIFSSLHPFIFLDDFLSSRIIKSNVDRQIVFLPVYCLSSCYSDHLWVNEVPNVTIFGMSSGN